MRRCFPCSARHVVTNEGRMSKLLAAAASFAVCALPHVFAQTACHGTILAGTVRDSTRALIPGAALTMDEGQSATSGSDGTFAFRCVVTGLHHLSIVAPGFSKRDLSLTAPHAAQMDIVLQPEVVETQVEVNGNDGDSP